MSMTDARQMLLLGIAACAVFLIVLSFLPWVEFITAPVEPGILGDLRPQISFSLDGTELSRLRGTDYDQPADILGQETNPCTCRVSFGDGYVVAAFGLALLGVAGAGLFLPLATRFVAVLAMAISLVALLVSGYNATGDWMGVGARTLDDTFVNLDGTVQPALWALVAVSALAAVLGAAIWSLERAAEREADEYEYDEEPEDTMTERAEGWA